VRATPGDLTGRSLLAVFAHPDDESLACGGLLAWCASRGVRVSLLCATSGEAGPGPANLAETRAKELEAAGETLGLSEIILLDCEDGVLTWTDDLDATIEDEIRRLAPDVVITFGEDGLYWHPDHVAVHHRTTAAVAAVGETAPALYYVTMPPGSMRAVVDRAAAKAADSAASPPRLVLGIADPDAFGAEASPPTLVVDVGDFAAVKLAAIKCHHTQLEDDALAALNDDDALRLLGVEHYRRAGVGGRGDAFLERFAVET
jgi:LmbE family N-acetylglucosaminyl deacetylase